MLRLGRGLLWLNIAAIGVLSGWYLLQPVARKREVSQLVQNAFVSEKRVSPLDVLWDLWQLYYADGASAAYHWDGDRRLLMGGIPKATTFSHGTIHILSNKAYLAGYCETLRNPVWAAYRIHDLDRLKPPPSRPERFEIDTRTMAKVPSDAFVHSRYDRGHLAPNYAIATRFGANAQRETFLMSNVVPQMHGLNAGLWKDLEMRIATDYPARYEEIWVVCGPIFPEKPKRIGKRVAVPDSFFMIIVDDVEGRLRTQSFVFPQEPDPGAPLASYAASIDAIEVLTGLDFFSELDPQSVAALEARVNRTVW